MKKNEKMQSSNKVNNKQQNKVTNRNNNKVSNKQQSCNVTNSNKNVGFVSDSDSFELDPDSDHSFELR